MKPRYQDATSTHISDIHITDPQDPSTRPYLGNLLCGGLSLLDVAADDAGVRSKMDEGTSLGAPDGTGTAGDEQHAVLCITRSLSEIVATKGVLIYTD